jgi:hypothetical protein
MVSIAELAVTAIKIICENAQSKLQNNTIKRYSIVPGLSATIRVNSDDNSDETVSAIKSFVRMNKQKVICIDDLPSSVVKFKM